ncbi:hypothetical protein [Arenimonas daejeonensis]|uniref:hypothetical protein n=1 Tax=Arenimonas daejeonensis TaxID=370777 RepID=UPI0011BEB039|nr:hypothetical protein [Arenimonas daejeonensis]
MLAAGPVVAASPAGLDAQVDRLTDALVVLMPFGRLLDEAAGRDPAWPAQGLDVQVSAPELACLRDELSSPGYRRFTHARVSRYADTRAARLEDDIELLESGAAELFGKLVLAGAEAESNGTEADPDAVLAGATKDQIRSFEVFFGEVQYRELRELAGVGDRLNQESSMEANEKAGEEMGTAMAVTLMKTAMETCGVDLPGGKD